jgi:hypothetical protein
MPDVQTLCDRLVQGQVELEDRPAFAAHVDVPRRFRGGLLAHQPT